MTLVALANGKAWSFSVAPVFRLDAEDEDNVLALLVGVESMVYSKLTEVADAGKFASSV